MTAPDDTAFTVRVTRDGDVHEKFDVVLRTGDTQDGEVAMKNARESVLTFGMFKPDTVTAVVEPIGMAGGEIFVIVAIVTTNPVEK